MPRVGTKKFSYSKKGKAAAKAYAKRTGKKITKSSSKKGKTRMTKKKYMEVLC